MTSFAIPEAELVGVLDILRVTFYVEIAAMAISLYDPVLTLSEEIDMLWNRPWSWGNLIYLINRYFVPLQAVLAMVAALDADVSNSTCLHLGLFAELWSFPIITTIIESLLIVRVCALYGNQTKVQIALWTLLACSFASTAAMIGVTSRTDSAQPSLAPGVMGCFLTTVTTPLGWGVWIPGLFVETVLFLMTVAKTLEHVRVAVNTPVLTVLLRDGCIYFIIIFILMLSNMVIYALPTQTGGYLSIITELELCLSSVLSSRMFLNLRGALYSGRPPMNEDESEPSYELHPRRIPRSRSSYGMDEATMETGTTHTEFTEAA